MVTWDLESFINSRDLLCVPSFQGGQLFQAIPEHPGEKGNKDMERCRESSVNIASPVQEDPRPILTLAHLGPRRSTITSTARFTRFPLQREKRPSRLCRFQLGKGRRAHVYWGLLKGGFRLGARNLIVNLKLSLDLQENFW